jgi:hypothetical protein
VFRFLVKNPRMCAPSGYNAAADFLALGFFPGFLWPGTGLQHKAAFPLHPGKRRVGTAYLASRINSFATNKMYGKTSGFRSPTMPTKYMMYTIYTSTVTETKKYGI